MKIILPQKLKPYYYKNFIKIKGVPYIIIDPQLGHRGWQGRFTYDFLIGWRRKIQKKEFANTMAKKVSYKYTDSIEFIKKNPKQVKQMIKFLYKNMRVVLKNTKAK